MNKRGMNKRGQLTIFIIIAIFIMAAVVSFFLLRGKVSIKIGGVPRTEAPQSFLEICLEDKVKEGIKIISSQGGYISNPLNKSFKFKDEEKPTDISYLCYNQNYYSPCVNQQPMLIQHLENEIKNYISDDVTNCFNDLIKSLRKQGYDVIDGFKGFEIELQPKRIVVNISAELTLTRAEETSRQGNFKVTIPSRLYEIINTVNRIVNDEATSYDFDYVFYMRNNPKFDVDKFETADATEIYVVRHKDTNERFNLAIRGCVNRV